MAAQAIDLAAATQRILVRIFPLWILYSRYLERANVILTLILK